MSKPATTVDLAAFKKQLADSLERSAKSASVTVSSTGGGSARIKTER
jgi:hypothetical protein